MALSTVCFLLLIGLVIAQDAPEAETDYDKPVPLYPGEVEIYSDEPCPNGLYEDPERPASPNTKICVEARLNCKPGVTWQSLCNTCTCSKGARNLGVIECTEEDCTGFVLPEPNLGNSNVCAADVTDCPAGCGFVRRDFSCIYCQCGEPEKASAPPPALPEEPLQPL